MSEIVVAHSGDVSLQLLGDVLKALFVGLGARHPGAEAVLLEKMLKGPHLVEGGFRKWA